MHADTLSSRPREADVNPRAAAAGATSARDLRLDFFRGLALIFIFIDHVPGNALAHVTMRALGLSDAAEVFVLIAGFAAFTAYAGRIEQEGFRLGVMPIFRRVRDLYAAHLVLVAVCGSLLAVAARAFENPLYFEDVNLTPLAYDPLGAIWRLLVLAYQPGYMNILPLYMLLLAWLPALMWLLRRNHYAALAVSVSIWLMASKASMNLPSWPEVYGWYFNPFAWQLLFSIGAFAAFQSRRGVVVRQSRLLMGGAFAVTGIGFVVAAPWINVPLLELPRLVPYDVLGHVSKTDLAPWRLAHILSVAYLVSILVPEPTIWLRSRAATWLVNCGRNSLDIFCLGTLLSFCGFIVILEAGRTWEYQVAVNVLGIGGMLCTAAWLTQRKARRAILLKAGRGQSSEGQATREVTGEAVPAGTGAKPSA